LSIYLFIIQVTTSYKVFVYKILVHKLVVSYFQRYSQTWQFCRKNCRRYLYCSISTPM